MNHWKRTGRRGIYGINEGLTKRLQYSLEKLDCTLNIMGGNRGESSRNEHISICIRDIHGQSLQEPGGLPGNTGGFLDNSPALFFL